MSFLLRPPRLHSVLHLNSAAFIDSKISFCYVIVRYLQCCSLLHVVKCYRIFTLISSSFDPSLINVSGDLLVPPEGKTQATCQPVQAALSLFSTTLSASACAQLAYSNDLFPYCLQGQILHQIVKQTEEASHLKEIQ